MRTRSLIHELVIDGKVHMSGKLPKASHLERKLQRMGKTEAFIKHALEAIINNVKTSKKVQRIVAAEKKEREKKK